MRFGCGLVGLVGFDKLSLSVTTKLIYIINLQLSRLERMTTG